MGLSSPLDVSKLVSPDFETHRTQPGLLAPPPVCLAVAHPDGRSEFHLATSDTSSTGLDRLEALLDSDRVLCGANLAFDMAVACAARESLIPKAFRKYAAGEVFDVLIAEALDAIAKGHLGIDPNTGGKLVRWDAAKQHWKQTDRYSLEIVSRLRLGRHDAKANDAWKLRYHELETLPLAEWPSEAVQYPQDDTKNGLDCATDQVLRGLNLGWIEDAPALREKITHMTHQARAAFAMHLACVWGMRTDGETVERLAERVEKKHAEAVAEFKVTGFIRDDGSENQALVKRAVALAYGASGACPVCGGSGKVPSPKTKKPINCKVSEDSDGEWQGCDGTGLNLTLAPSLPRADKGGVKIDRDVKNESGDDVLEAYAGVSENEKLRDTYLPFLRSGVSQPITLKSNVLVETGRASYEGLIQLLPRKGGVRDCFVARPGFVLCSTDYSALELCTLAEVCLRVLGWSKMADEINRTGDPGVLHTLFGAKMLAIEPDAFKARVKAKEPVAVGGRHMAKAANFGFPGLMGGCTLAIQKRKEGLRFCIAAGMAPPCPACEGVVGNEDCRRCYGRGALCGLRKAVTWGLDFRTKKPRKIPPTCITCIEIGEHLKKQYLEQWEEMPEYFKWVMAHPGFRDNAAVMRSPGSGYLRGGMGSNAANHPFQHLASMGAKHALWRCTQECFTDRRSVLYGSARPVVFAHDEVISEVREEVAHECGLRQAEILVESMREFVPNVAVGCEPALMRRWLKDAEPVKNAQGRLIPWEPKQKAAKSAERERYVQRAAA